jgi:hypothetical protein
VTRTKGPLASRPVINASVCLIRTGLYSGSRKRDSPPRRQVEGLSLKPVEATSHAPLVA